MRELSEAFGRFVFNFVFSIIAAIYNAWLFKDLWNWFVSPATGAPSISTAIAYGLLMVAAWPLIHILFFTSFIHEKTDGKFSNAARTLTITFVHTMTWGIAYVIAHNFV